jgi:hypothetical protein
MSVKASEVQGIRLLNRQLLTARGPHFGIIGSSVDHHSLQLDAEI